MTSSRRRRCSSIYADVGRDRRPGPRRCPDRGGRSRLGVRDRRGFVLRVARRRPARRARAAQGRGCQGGARIAARGLAVPRRAARDPRDVRPRHERDGLRDAAGALPGDRRAPLRRGRRASSACSTRRRRRGRSRRAASGWIGHVRRQGVAVALAIVVWGMAIAIFGFATALWLALVMLAIAGAADNISAILRSTILFASTPTTCAAACSGIELAQVASTPALGNVEAGIVASLTSLRFSSSPAASRASSAPSRSSRSSPTCSATTRARQVSDTGTRD